MTARRKLVYTPVEAGVRLSTAQHTVTAADVLHMVNVGQIPWRAVVRVEGDIRLVAKHIDRMAEEGLR